MSSFPPGAYYASSAGFPPPDSAPPSGYPPPASNYPPPASSYPPPNGTGQSAPPRPYYATMPSTTAIAPSYPPTAYPPPAPAYLPEQPPAGAYGAAPGAAPGYPAYPPSSGYPGYPPQGYGQPPGYPANGGYGTMPPAPGYYPPQGAPPGYPGYPPAYPPPGHPGYAGYPPSAPSAYPPPAYPGAYPPPAGYPPQAIGYRGRSRSRSRSRSRRRSPKRSGGKQDNGQAAQISAAAVEQAMGLEPLKAELLAAVESLYDDRIKPVANYVRGRLKERSCSDGLVRNFLELYARFPDVFDIIRTNQNGETEVTINLMQTPGTFKGWVDMDSPDDPYDEETWQGFEKFLETESSFAGGRYGVARELKQRKLSFFSNLCLGQVCHLVQLAIQHRKILVYHRKMLKPLHAVAQSLATPNNDAAGGQADDLDEIRNMDDLCGVLFQMLRKQPNGIPLCRLKQQIKQDFSRKLVEITFKCTKLRDLFTVEPLSSTFALITENEGKSIIVRLGNPDMFSESVKRIFYQVNR